MNSLTLGAQSAFILSSFVFIFLPGWVASKMAKSHSTYDRGDNWSMVYAILIGPFILEIVIQGLFDAYPTPVALGATVLATVALSIPHTVLAGSRGPNWLGFLLLISVPMVGILTALFYFSAWLIERGGLFVIPMAVATLFPLLCVVSVLAGERITKNPATIGATVASAIGLIGLIAWRVL